MPRTRMQSVTAWLRRAVMEPRSELNRWQRTIRFGYELGIVGAHQLRQDRAAQMAAALAYRTLFGLIPTLVVTTILVRAFGGFSDLEAAVQEQLRSMRLDEITARADTDGARGNADARTTDATAPGAAATDEGAARDDAASGADAEVAANSLEALILDALAAVEQINITALSWIGAVVLIYSAISLMSTIESSFNIICRAPEGRPWIRRVPVYWTVLTLGSILIGLAALVDHRVDVFLESYLAQWGWALRAAAVLWSALFTMLLLTAVYKLVPNANVPTKPAMIGAAVAMILIEIIKRSFGTYVEHAVSLEQLSGSLGVLPLFMFWVYLLWLVILFGLEVAQVLVRRGGRALEELRRGRPLPSVVDPASILVIAGAWAECFAEGRPASAAEIASETGLPESAVRAMGDRLADEGILVRVDRAGDPMTFGRPPDSVEASELLDIGYAMFDEASGGTVGQVLAKLRVAERSATEGLTAAALSRWRPAGAAPAQG